MKKNLLRVATIVAILFFAACSKYMPSDDNLAPNAIPTGRTMTFTASMPVSPTPRVALDEDGLDINVTWKTGDKIQLVLVQGPNTLRLTQADVTPDPTNAHIGTFTIDLPEDGYLGFVENAAFKLYGVHGGGGFDGASTLAILPSNMYTGVENASIPSIQNNDHVMLHFSIDIPAGSTVSTVDFKHLGSIFVINIKNTRILNFVQVKGVELVGVSNPNNLNWAYNSYVSGNTYDLATGEFSNIPPNEDVYNYLHFKRVTPLTINTNETDQFIAWYPLIPGKEWPALKVKLKRGETGIEYKDNNSTYPAILSNNNRAAKTPEVGKTYHFYATLKAGNNLNFTNALGVQY